MNWYWIFILGIISGWALLAILFFALKGYVGKIMMKRAQSKMSSQMGSMMGMEAIAPPTEEQLQEAELFFKSMVGSLGKDIVPPNLRKKRDE